jgi:protein-S-isoprenylcysteine O-methyltransferase Ste14
LERLRAILGSALFLVIAPGIVAGVVPWWISGWNFATPVAGYGLVRVVGIVFIAAGLPVLLEAFARFALHGLGTPAPVYPTRHLVVRGTYRHVRNPMYLAVEALIVGQGLLFGSAHLLVYAGLLAPVFHLFVIGYEEPTLRWTFGAEYEAYCAGVRRWLPRLSPWRGDAAQR